MLSRGNYEDLTKYVDVVELLTVLDTESANPVPFMVGSDVVRSEILPCTLQRATPGATVGGPTVLWSQNDPARIIAENRTFTLAPGESAFLPAGAGEATLTSGSCWVVGGTAP
jgi:mannose-6-phosphate isomerase class I